MDTGQSAKVAFNKDLWNENHKRGTLNKCWIPLTFFISLECLYLRRWSQVKWGWGAKLLCKPLTNSASSLSGYFLRLDVITFGGQFKILFPWRCSAGSQSGSCLRAAMKGCEALDRDELVTEQGYCRHPKFHPKCTPRYPWPDGSTERCSLFPLLFVSPLGWLLSCITLSMTPRLLHVEAKPIP